MASKQEPAARHGPAAEPAVGDVEEGDDGERVAAAAGSGRDSQRHRRRRRPGPRSAAGGSRRRRAAAPGHRRASACGSSGEATTTHSPLGAGRRRLERIGFPERTCRHAHIATLVLLLRRAYGDVGAAYVQLLARHHRKRVILVSASLRAAPIDRSRCQGWQRMSRRAGCSLSWRSPHPRASRRRMAWWAMLGSNQSPPPEQATSIWCHRGPSVPLSANPFLRVGAVLKTVAGHGEARRSTAGGPR